MVVCAIALRNACPLLRRLALASNPLSQLGCIPQPTLNPNLVCRTASCCLLLQQGWRRQPVPPSSGFWIVTALRRQGRFCHKVGVWWGWSYGMRVGVHGCVRGQVRLPAALGSLQAKAGARH